MSQYCALPQLKLLVQASPTIGSRQVPGVLVPPSETTTFPKHWPVRHACVLLQATPASTAEDWRHVRNTSSQLNGDAQSEKPWHAAPAAPFVAHWRFVLQYSVGAQSVLEPLQASPTAPSGPHTRADVQRSPTTHSDDEAQAALAALRARHCEPEQYASGTQRKLAQGEPMPGSVAQTRIGELQNAPAPHSPSYEHVEPIGVAFRHTPLAQTKGVVQVPSGRHDSPRLPPAMQRRMQVPPLQPSVASVQSASEKQAAFGAAAGAVTREQSVGGPLEPVQERPENAARQACALAGLKVEYPAATARSEAPARPLKAPPVTAKYERNSVAQSARPAAGSCAQRSA